MAKPEARRPTKRKKPKGSWVVYALAAVLVVDLLLMFVPLGGIWSANYAFAVGAVVVMAALVYVSRGVSGGFEDVLGRLDESSTTLESSLQGVAQSVEKLGVDSSVKIGSLEKSIADVTQTVKALKDLRSDFAKAASETERMGSGLGEKIATLQGTLEGMVKSFASLEKTDSEISGTLDALKFNMKEAELSSADLRRAAILLGTAESEKGRVAVESKELLLAIGKNLGEVRSGVAELEKGSAEARVRLDGIAGTRASISKVEKAVSRVDGKLARLAKVEGEVSRVEKHLSKIDSKLDRAAGRRRTKTSPTKRAKSSVWNVDSALASSEESEGVERAVQDGTKDGGDASSGNDAS